MSEFLSSHASGTANSGNEFDNDQRLTQQQQQRLLTTRKPQNLKVRLEIYTSCA
ncbi:GH12062 [Drosophila grimshawi]|uniref:GH12062 n=1 Tax=Drosophila grimshawi TaxID=7222 RepID=B4K4B8_DROGR|nr:GH12062 [Drosophila grimshawi]